MQWVVTGANRGIGLELVRQLSARGDSVVALARRVDDGELSSLVSISQGRVRAIACDVTDDASVARAASQIGSEAVDVLVNNAGVKGQWSSITDLDLGDVMRCFDVNAVGAIRVTRALLPNLLRSQARKVVSITSGMGSIGDNTQGGAYAYRMSKAALNMAMRSLSVDYRDRGLISVVINPGWVQTAMGGAGAPTPVNDSVRMMLERIDALTLTESGAFLNYKGGNLLW